ncbi:hypothetical protein [Spongiactinospora sp. TRM90649]|uniref:hypothetical protein n=1 Tax=Spongiactinospora sp. TRM90649 TaxID=3031114 RepID=UPI0023F79E72|nr:hypothetical protein [Spongiactinospora sp. TRM90649]MDF5758219.1 hypothetical protein [Spongiactinospora sp. TRM90649]
MGAGLPHPHEPVGVGALHACLPGPLWEAFVASASPAGPGMGFWTHRLRTLTLVPASLMSGDLSTPSVPARSGTKAWLRLCEAVPAIKRRSFAGQWTPR